MKNRFFAVVMGCLLVFSCFVGCSGKEDTCSTMEKIQKQLNEMKSYECTATLKRNSNKGQNVYETKQYYKTTGEYKLLLTSPKNVAGNYTVFDGKTVCQFNPKLGGKVIMNVPKSQCRNELFLGNFMKNYMQSEGVSVDVAKMDEGECTVLEAIIPGNNKYIASEKLWIDNETLKPTQFVIYNSDGKESYIVNYNEFEYNVDFDEDLFKIEKDEKDDHNDHVDED